MRPLLIVGRVMCGMRPASAASEAIEAEVLLMVWDVLHPRAVGKGGVVERRELTAGAYFDILTILRVFFFIKKPLIENSTKSIKKFFTVYGRIVES